MDKLYVLIKEQFPEFVQADYPKFVEFVQAYYKWLEDYLPKDIKQIVDIDDTPDEYLSYFVKQLDVYGLLNDTSPYQKKYIKNIKEFHTSKGSEQGLLFLLKAVYDSDVLIDHPIQYVLKPSDGKWVQEKFITLRAFLGSVETISQWDFSYDCRCAGRNQILDVTRTEVIDQQTVRFYFQQQTSTVLFVGQKINVYNSFGELMFIGEIVISPARIEVVDGGSGWRLGQVIVWPGSQRNTIVRVVAIDDVGSIKRIEVIDIGYDHNDGEVLYVSPYSVKPLTPLLYTISNTQLTFGDNPSFHYTVNIAEETERITDVVEGIGYGSAPTTPLTPLLFTSSSEQLTFGNNPSFHYTINVGEDILTATDVVEGVGPKHDGFILFTKKIFALPTLLGPTNINAAQWATSRTTLAYNFDTIAQLNGKWLDESSHVSTDSNRLQDSFYYQQYSYVIESDVNPVVYKDLAKQVHIAGAKMFTKFNATSRFDINSRASVTFPFITLNVLDVASPTDLEYNKEVIKLRASEILSTDRIARKNVTKPRVDATLGSTDAIVKDFASKFRLDLATPSDAVVKAVTKPRVDVSTGTDAVAKNVTKPRTDAALGVDSIIKDVTKPRTDATLGSTDAAAKNVTKPRTDASTGTDVIAGKAVTKPRVDTTLGSTDAVVKNVTKPRTDTAAGTDAVVKNVTKPRVDTTLGSTDAVAKNVTKPRTDAALGVDSIIKDVTKPRTDAALGVDSIIKNVTKPTVELALEANDNNGIITRSLIMSQFDLLLSSEDISSKSIDKYANDDIEIEDPSIFKHLSIIVDPDSVVSEDEVFIGRAFSFDLTDSVDVFDVLTGKAATKVVSDSTENTSDTIVKTTAKYTQDASLVEDFVVKRPTSKFTSSVIADSPDTSDKDVDEYFLSSENYNVASDRYAQVTVTATIP